MRHQTPAVVVAGQHRPVILLQCLPESLIRRVRDIQDHAQPIHLGQQGHTQLGQAQLDACATRIATWAEVGDPQHTQAGFPPLLQLIWAKDGVCPFCT